MDEAYRSSGVLVSAAELAEIIGTDLETVNNWIRRGIINRTPTGRTATQESAVFDG